MKNVVTKLLSICLILVFVLGCKKNANKGKFNIELTDVNGDDFVANSQIIFTFNINHPISEVTKDTLFVKKKFFTCSQSDRLDTLLIPTYTSTANFETTYELKYLLGSNSNFAATCEIGRKTDSLIYSFWAKDRNGNKSDTVKTQKIILRKG